MRLIDISLFFFIYLSLSFSVIKDLLGLALGNCRDCNRIFVYFLMKLFVCSFFRFIVSFLIFDHESFDCGNLLCRYLREERNAFRPR